jgi:predicted lactoylglutathione lyase
VIVALSADSRSRVDDLANRAIAAGAIPVSEPEDQGFMYSRSFEDLDGHLWEVIYMDPAAVK